MGRKQGKAGELLMSPTTLKLVPNSLSVSNASAAGNMAGSGAICLYWPNCSTESPGG